MSPEMQQRMRDLLPKLKGYIVAVANECSTEKENIDFVLSVAVNLVGNLTWQASGDSVERLQKLANVTLNNLIAWYAQTIEYQKNRNEAH